MDTTTTVNSFQATKNQILGRLSQCTDTESLHQQLQREAADIETHQFTHQEMDALVGIDRGIKAATSAIEGDTEPLDTL
jgi:hypothetical protein